MGPPSLTPHIYSHLQFKGDRFSRGSPAHANSPAVPAGGTQERPKSAVKSQSPAGFLGDFVGRTPESLPELAFESLPYPEPDRRIAAVDWSRRCLFFPLEGIHAARKSISTRHLFTGRARSCA